MEIKNNKHIHSMEHDDAIVQLKRIMSSIEVCMFETIQPEPPFHVRPMSPVKIDDDGSVWFFSSRSSKKNKEIAAYPGVQLMFSNVKDNEFVSMFGTAEIIIDQKKFEEYWNTSLKVWFPDGTNDPDLSLIKVSPQSSYYWNSMHNKMAAVIKAPVPEMEAAGIDDGIEGA
jgi:general stress protein 26